MLEHSLVKENYTVEGTQCGMHDCPQPKERTHVAFLLALTGFLLFFLLLFVPTSYKELKAILLAGLLIGISLGALKDRVLRIHRQVFILFYFYSWMGMAYVFYGCLNGNPGAIEVSTVYVIWPLVYMFLVSAISKEWVLRGLAQVLVLASIAVSLYALYYYFYMLGIVPSTLYIELDLGQGIGFYNGFVEYRLYSISTLIFLFPFTATCLVLWSTANNAPVSPKWLVVAFILLSCASILSGRRALWLVMGLTPLLIITVMLFTRSKSTGSGSIIHIKFLSYLAVIGAILSIVFSTVFDVSLFSILESFLEGFQFGSTSSSSARSEQFFALINAWVNNPIFGTGFGAPVEGSLRSIKSPWAFELYFLSVLYHTGLVGFVAYAFGIGWIVFYGLKIIMYDRLLRLYMIPVLVGMLCFLIASNTNPYLAKFDYLWVVFLPVAIINCYLLKGGTVRSRE